MEEGASPLPASSANSTVKVRIVVEDGEDVAAEYCMAMAAIKKSGFLSTQASERWAEVGKRADKNPVLNVRARKDEVEGYMSALKLMEGESNLEVEAKNVSRAVQLLKACASLLYEEGMQGCMRYLRDVTWREGEETEEVVATIKALQLKEGDAVLSRQNPIY